MYKNSSRGLLCLPQCSADVPIILNYGTQCAQASYMYIEPAS